MEVGLDESSFCGLREVTSIPPETHESEQVMREGWECWSRKFCGGIRIQRISASDAEGGLVTYTVTFFLPQGRSEAQASYRKIRLIADERGRNFSGPISDHLELHRHKSLIDFFTLGLGLDDLNSTKEELEKPTEQERSAAKQGTTEI